jgi:RNA recognition motif-containing protein
METSKLFVGNLDYSVSNDELKALFESQGTVVEAYVIPDKGFGFVAMSTPQEAENAMNALNDTDFQGRDLRINEARPKTAR